MMGRGNAQYEHGPAIQTVAPREGEDEDPQTVPEEGVQQAVKASIMSGAMPPVDNEIAVAG